MGNFFFRAKPSCVSNFNTYKKAPREQTANHYGTPNYSIELIDEEYDKLCKNVQELFDVVVIQEVMINSTGRLNFAIYDRWVLKQEIEIRKKL